MLNIGMPRFIWTFLLGFAITSNLNWAVAELLLNDWAMPRFEGFMRTLENGGGDPANIVKMTLGFMGPLLVMAWMQASVNWPAGWVTRAVFSAMLVSLGAFYGTYTFISGWGQVNWWPLMVTATCDTATMIVGGLLIGFMQERGRRS